MRDRIVDPIHAGAAHELARVEIREALAEPFGLRVEHQPVPVVEHLVRDRERDIMERRLGSGEHAQRVIEPGAVSRRKRDEVGEEVGRRALVAEPPRDLSRDRLLEIFARATSPAFATQLSVVLDRGGPIDLDPTAFAPCLAGETKALGPNAVLVLQFRVEDARACDAAGW